MEFIIFLIQHTYSVFVNKEGFTGSVNQQNLKRTSRNVPSDIHIEGLEMSLVFLSSASKSSVTNSHLSFAALSPSLLPLFLIRTNTTPSLTWKKNSRDFAKTSMMLGDLIQELFLEKTSSNTSLTFNDNKGLA